MGVLPECGIASCTMRVPGAYGGLKKGSNLLDPELQMVMRYLLCGCWESNLGIELCKSDKCS